MALPLHLVAVCNNCSEIICKHSTESELRLNSMIQFYLVNEKKMHNNYYVFIYKSFQYRLITFTLNVNCLCMFHLFHRVFRFHCSSFLVLLIFFLHHLNQLRCIDSLCKLSPAAPCFVYLIPLNVYVCVFRR